MPGPNMLYYYCYAYIAYCIAHNIRQRDSILLNRPRFVVSRKSYEDVYAAISCFKPGIGRFRFLPRTAFGRFP